MLEMRRVSNGAPPCPTINRDHATTGIDIGKDSLHIVDLDRRGAIVPAAEVVTGPKAERELNGASFDTQQRRAATAALSSIAFEISAAMTTCVGLSEMMIGAALAGMSSRGAGYGRASQSSHAFSQACDGVVYGRPDRADRDVQFGHQPAQSSSCSMTYFASKSREQIGITSTKTQSR
jgi:hypothetical protein